MAFTQSTFGPISSHGNSDMPNIWTYRTGDSKVQVSGVDYFIKKYPLINDGDFINVKASNGVFSGTFSESNGQFTIVDLNTGGGGGSSLDQDQMIYVSKAGNDSNSGLNINEPKLTINEAISDASLLTPSESNQITIEVIDSGNYIESPTLPEWVHIDAKNAALNGRLTVEDNTISSFRRLQNSTIGQPVARKASGAGFAKLAVELLIVGDGAQEGLLVDAGVMHIDAGVISIDAGIGIKAKNGSRVSFIISEVQLLNGGLGIGTRTAGGGANFFSGNVLYAKDDGTGVLLEAKVSGDVINIQAGSLIVDTLYDMGANTTLNIFSTEAAGSVTANATATVNSTVAGKAAEVGYLVYSDLATASTQIVHTGGVDTILTNDELGAQTQKTFAPTGVTDVWDSSGGVFDFSELANGDMVDIRLNVTVTTSTNNQEVFINLELGQGGFDYLVPFTHDIYKLSGTVPLGSYEGVFIGDDNTRLNNGQFIFSSDDNATIIVHGWYCKVIRRG